MLACANVLAASDLRAGSDRHSIADLRGAADGRSAGSGGTLGGTCFAAVGQAEVLSVNLSESSVTMTKTPAPRKQLSADALFRSIHQSCQGIPDPRTGKLTISLPDALMSGLAMFALMDPSMLAFIVPAIPVPGIAALSGCFALRRSAFALPGVSLVYSDNGLDGCWGLDGPWQIDSFCYGGSFEWRWT